MGPESVYKLFLYVATQVAHGTDPVVKNVTDSLRALCGDRYDLQIIEVVKNPKDAVDNGILFTPTLVRVLPEPKKRVVGNFLDPEKVMAALKLIQSTA